MKVNFTIFKVFFLFLFFSSFFAFSQKGSLSGTIKDNMGVPIAGANLSIEQSKIGASSDFDGVYKISNIPYGKVVVVASYLGFKTQKIEIEINGDVKLDIVLDDDSTQLQDVVVTGVLNPKSKLESSVSVSSVNSKQIEEAAPRVTAEVFRSIPGIKSESTGGEGNANVTVRGIPVASGGGKFLQMQEDGLPVMQFGDVAFGNADIFLRYDQTVSRVESIRGGSASTLASNSPAGIINFISKNGSVEGGSVTQSLGVDFNNTRTDFEYGCGTKR